MSSIFYFQPTLCINPTFPCFSFFLSFFLQFFRVCPLTSISIGCGFSNYGNNDDLLKLYSSNSSHASHASLSVVPFYSQYFPKVGDLIIINENNMHCIYYVSHLTRTKPINSFIMSSKISPMCLCEENDAIKHLENIE